MASSWRPEVQTDDSGNWYQNGLRFATKEEAEANVANLKANWAAVRSTRVVESDDPPNYRWSIGGLMPFSKLGQSMLLDEQKGAVK